MIKNILIGIRNIVHYLPVIWNDRQWDERYFHLLIHKKLILMEEFYRKNDDKDFKSKIKSLFRSNKYSVYSCKTHKKIYLLKLLSERIIKENYLENATVVFDKKYPDYYKNIVFEECGDKNGKFVLKMMIDRNPESVQKELSRLQKHANKQEKQDIDVFCSILNKYGKNFYDQK